MQGTLIHGQFLEPQIDGVTNNNHGLQGPLIAVTHLLASLSCMRSLVASVKNERPARSNWPFIGIHCIQEQTQDHGNSKRKKQKLRIKKLVDVALLPGAKYLRTSRSTEEICSVLRRKHEKREDNQKEDPE